MHGNDNGYDALKFQEEFNQWLDEYEKEDYKFCHTD